MKLKSVAKLGAWSLLPVFSLALVGFSSLTQKGTLEDAQFDGKSVPQGQLSSDRIQSLQDKVQVIVTPYGEFVRDHPGNYLESEIARSKDEINASTKEIILPYGTFVKQSPEEMKQAQMNDSQWAQHHTRQWIEQEHISSTHAR